MQPIIDMTSEYAKWKADFKEVCRLERAFLESKRNKKKNPSGLSDNMLYTSALAKMQANALYQHQPINSGRGMASSCFTNQLFGWYP